MGILRLRVSVCLFLFTVFRSESFLLTSPKQQHERFTGGSSCRFWMAAAANDDNDHDLFEYFDPLLSPHAYPNGVSPQHKPDQSFKRTGVSEDAEPFPGANELLSAIKKELKEVDDKKVKDEEPDLLDYFDPLLSPHAYPNGVSSKQKPDHNFKNRNNHDEESYDPLRLNIANLRGSPPPPSKRSVVLESPPDLFDPTLSPHMYPRGTPSMIIGDEGNNIPQSQPPIRRIGILLMDHGSRNQASNERLHELARLYQESVDSHVIVRAAHMEIATPSIQDGLASLASEGVDEIICHPFFLSPFGRHVSEDIPTIVDDAIRELDIQVPVCTTKAIGSNTDLMLNAIHTIVQESSSMSLLRQKSRKY